MSLGMPKLNIKFKQLEGTIIERSAKGRLALIVIDDTGDKSAKERYLSFSDVKKADYKEENYQFIEDAFRAGAKEVVVIRLKTSETVNEHAAPQLNNTQFDWVAIASEGKTHHDAIVTYVKNYNKNHNYKIKGLVYKATAPDDMHIVNYTTTRFSTISKQNQEGWKLIPYLAGLLSGLPFTRSSTYAKVPVESVEEPSDLDAAVDKGEFFLFNDEHEVRVARGVNSLTTITATETEDMRSIAVVEAMDIILKDIHEAFKSYIGNFKNKYDNQALFIAGVNGYFKTLAGEDILDPEFYNFCEVDVDAQRNAWLSIGKSEAARWNNQEVKSKTFKRQVFLRANIKILDAMEDLTFTINMI